LAALAHADGAAGVEHKNALFAGHVFLCFAQYQTGRLKKVQTA
jgi:hypothetical protein